MRILIINGGPHKGNTWRLAEIVREIFYNFDKTIIFEEIHLSDIDLPFCTGCSNCFRKGHVTCPHNKIIQPIMDKIEESDAVIFSVPCFQGHLPGILKNFTDHMAFMLHRPRYFTKKALIISTTGGVSADSTTKALAATLPGWGTSIYLVDMQLVQPLCKSVWRFLKRIKIGLKYDPTLPHFGLYPKELKSAYFRNACMPMFIKAQFTKARL